MADLDDLLEDLELETQSPPGSRRASKLSPAPKPPTKAGDSYSKAKRDVDDLLDDLDDVLADDSPHVPSEPTPAPSQATDSTEPVVASTGKCFPVYIGGSKDEQGLTPGRACDRLRCTKCDFEVKRWENIAWSESCDYLFFRNFFPDGEKLSKNMVKTKGSCGYACQCTWKSASELTALQKSPEMRWVCSGHRKAIA
mmetsp:Transcript_18742/g.45028  ORF Transcript_18742/g.45028 Transcript_18742/m.45028 type:complete len:197 (+) Transcript_18742:278-868(+)